MSGWALPNQSNKSVMGGPYPLLGFFSRLSFFLLSGLREPSTVLLENISPIFSLYFEPTGGVFWWYGGPFLSQQLG